MYLSSGAPTGYRVIYGVFDFDQHPDGVVLLNPDGSVRHVWQVSQEDVDWPHPSDTNVFPHGFEITRDGSILVAFDHGTSLTKYDYCGAVQWRLPGGFHHSIDLYDDETFWAWGNDGTPTQFGNHLHQIRVSDGKILRSIEIGQIMDANPDIDPFGIRQLDEQGRSRWIFASDDPFHHNDIDPLPPELAAHYPQFKAGDLLVSMRAINLLFVLDPDTLKVKWWRQGLTRRQHDPDWNDRGTITVLDNNMNRGNSRIVELNPRTLAYHTLLDGGDYGFYTWNRGKHQQLDHGDLLITSTAQGRVFEVSPSGQVDFDFHNLYSEEAGALVVSEARFLPLDYFTELPTCDR